MANMTDYLEIALLKQLFRNTPMATPATVYIGLHTAAVAEDATNTNEVTGGAYARVAMTTGAAGTGVGSAWIAPITDPTDATLSLVDNVADIVFVTPTAAWGTVTHFSIWDALTGGNKVFTGQLVASKIIASGDPVKFSLGDLDIKLG